MLPSPAKRAWTINPRPEWVVTVRMTGTSTETHSADRCEVAPGADFPRLTSSHGGDGEGDDLKVAQERIARGYVIRPARDILSPNSVSPTLPQDSVFILHLLLCKASCP